VDNKQIQNRLFSILWIYEALVISVCLFAGYNIATGQGGSVSMAAPLVLIASAEMVRIPLAGYSTRLSWPMRILSGIVMLAIALASFEGLAITFELFLTNRIHDVRTIQRTVEIAQEAVDAKRQEAQQSQAAIDSARMKVIALNAEIKDKETHPPQQPNVGAGSCHNRSGRAVSCNSDIQARRDFTLALKSHLETLKKLREQRDAGQANVDALTANIKPAGLLEAEKILKSKRQDLSDVLHQSPVYRLAASIFGVRVQDLSEEQFEIFKRVAIIGLSGSFATLSMFVSVVAHAEPRSNKPSKLSRAIRSYLARRRKNVVRTVEVTVAGPERTVEREVPVEVVREKTIIKHVPFDYKRGRRMPEYEPEAGLPLKTIYGGRQ
jgi:hypothetical protein